MAANQKQGLRLGYIAPDFEAETTQVSYKPVHLMET